MESGIWKCDVCEKSFMSSFGRRRHREKYHKKLPETYLRCPVCGFLSGHRNLTKHFENKHNLKIETETFLFETKADLIKFKLEKETETGSIFRLVKAGKLMSNGLLSKTYYCHRCVDKKNPGIKGICPAKIKAIYLTSGQILVYYISTHFGHKLNTTALPSPQISSDKNNLKKQSVDNTNDERDVLGDGLIEASRENTEGKQDLENEIANMKKLFDNVSNLVLTAEDADVVIRSLNSCITQLLV